MATFLSKIASVLSSLAGIAAPRLCAVCGEPLVEGERGICLKCVVALPRTGLHLSAARNEINSRITDDACAGRAAAWFRYNPSSVFAEMIRTAKYRDCPGLARDLGILYGCELSAAPAPRMADDVDLLLPVPMHHRKLLARGYNQSREIALGISEATGIPVGDNLVALRSHRTQTRRSRDSRRRNVAGIFAVEHPSELRGLRVAVVDDIITSGATVTECCRVLSKATGEDVAVLALGVAGMSPSTP